MRHIVARGQFAQRAHGKRFALAVSLLYYIFMVALEDLMIGVANNLFVVVYKTLAYRYAYRNKQNISAYVIKDAAQAFELFGVFCKNIGYIFFSNAFLQVFNKHIELPVEDRLFIGSKQERSVNFTIGDFGQRMIVPFYKMPVF